MYIGQFESIVETIFSGIKIDDEGLTSDFDTELIEKGPKVESGLDN